MVDPPLTDSEGVPYQNCKTKEYPLNEELEKEDSNTSFKGKIKIAENETSSASEVFEASLAEVNEYYQALNDKQKKIFNDSARKLIRTGEVDLRHSLVYQRTIRRRMYELLLGLDKWQKSMPKLVGDEPFYLPMETLISKHEYVDALSHTVENKEAAL